MALISCPECNKQISSAATACPSCAYPLSPEAQAHTPEAPSPKSSTKSASSGILTPIIFALGALVVIFMAVGFIKSGTPEGKAKAHDRRAIELCWDNQSQKSLDPSGQRFIAGACEKMESDFLQKYGVRP